MQIEFTVPGEPFGKQRPRHSRTSGTTYTPRETKLHEQKVIGEFVCDAIISHCEMANADIAEHQGRIRREQLFEYSNGSELYGWHISNLKIYDTPKELSEFGTLCNEDCPNCEFWKCDMVNQHERDMDCTNSSYPLRPLKRPPQSWCYVEACNDE